MERFLTTELAGETVAHQINEGPGTVVFLSTEQALSELAAGTVTFEDPASEAKMEAAILLAELIEVAKEEAAQHAADMAAVAQIEAEAQAKMAAQKEAALEKLAAPAAKAK